MHIFLIRNDMMNPLMKTGLQIFPSVIVGESLIFEAPSKVSPQCTVVKSSIGAYSYLNDRVEVNHTTIGRYCSIAKNAMIGAGDHPLSWITSSPAVYDRKIFGWYKGSISDLEQDSVKPVKIGHDVWIGANAVVRQGVILGQGSVVGANSVVTRDVDAYTIVGGTPAKVIRKRFSEDIIDRLIYFPWYDYDIPNWDVRRENFSFNNIDHRMLDKLQTCIDNGMGPKLQDKKYKIWFNGEGICISSLN